MLGLLFAGGPGSSRTLADLCDRVALSLDAGIDVRRVWRSEADRLSGHGGQACADVADAIAGGAPLDEAVADAGPFFPPLLRELVAVGERTGTTAEVFRRLAQHYQRQVDRARTFRAAITFPALQLLAALGVVGVLIALGGFLKNTRGKPVDFLGLGLVGGDGLIAYAGILIGLLLVLLMAATVLRRLPVIAASARAILSGLPIVGSSLRMIALARIAWALRLTMNVDMDLRKVAPVVLRASDNQRYARHADRVVERVGQGRPLSESFEETGAFPRRFLDMLLVAEQSGTIVESMDRLSRQYDEEAEAAVATLTRVAAFLVWAAVAALVVLLIFRVFAFYTGVLNEALEGL